MVSSLAQLSTSRMWDQRGPGDTVTGADGTFVFPDLLAGTFDLTVTLEGFKTYEQKGVVVTSTERVALPPIALAVGGLSEVVSVQAESVAMQTTSGERSATITAEQMRTSVSRAATSWAR